MSKGNGKAAPHGAAIDNAQIARAFEELADALEIQGDNPFRVRAYRTGARTVGDLTRSLAEMVQAGDDLTALPGIGKDLAAYIAELVETGHLGRLEKVEEKVPSSLVQLMKLEGLGPKRAKLLHETLGIRDLDGLEAALADGRVRKVRGFGDKSAHNLERAIRDLRKHTSRVKLSEADRLVEPLLAYLREAPGMQRVEVTGSYRRRRETVGDLDLLASSTRPGPAMKHFRAYPGFYRVAAAGSTRGTAVLHSGLHVDLRILPRRDYGAALHYFTGSKPHSIAVRRLGVARGLRISEYGVFRAKSGKRLGGEREQDVYDAVGLPWIPPELREDRGEIAAARAGELPELIAVKDIRGDLQMHSRYSDGRNSIEEMALACIERGYQYMAITDHSRAATVAGGLSVEDLERQFAEVEKLRDALGTKVAILQGMEVDIQRDGTLDLADAYLERLDIVVIAVHASMGLSRSAMTNRVLRAIHHPHVHILAHPTGRLINKREPFAIDLEAVFAAAAELGVALELNAQPDRLDLDDVQVRRARDLGVKIAIDTDAHSADTLRFMSYGVDQARRGWLRKQDVLNTMTWTELRRWLRSR